MSTHQNFIMIGDPEKLRVTIEAMIQAERVENFAAAWLRLTSLFTDYLGHDTPPERQRVARFWADGREPHQFSWYIQEEPISNFLRPSSADFKVLLAGGLVYDHTTKLWGIHT